MLCIKNLSLAKEIERGTSEGNFGAPDGSFNYLHSNITRAEYDEILERFIDYVT